MGPSRPNYPAKRNKRRDSNPPGCGAEETRSVFQRSTQGAKRRSGPRPPNRRTWNPSVSHRLWAPRVPTIQPSATSGGIRTRQGAELRKREAFSSAARKERSDAAGRGRRQADAESLRPTSAKVDFWDMPRNLPISPAPHGKGIAPLSHSISFSNRHQHFSSYAVTLPTHHAMPPK